MSRHQQKGRDEKFRCEQCLAGNCDLCLDTLRIYSDRLLCMCQRDNHHSDVERARALAVATMPHRAPADRTRQAIDLQTAGVQTGEL